MTCANPIHRRGKYYGFDTSHRPIEPEKEPSTRSEGANDNGEDQGKGCGPEGLGVNWRSGGGEDKEGAKPEEVKEGVKEKTPGQEKQ